MITIGINTSSCSHGYNSGTTCTTSLSFFGSGGDTTTDTTLGINLSSTNGQPIH